MVNITIRIFSSTGDSKLDLDMLDKRDRGKIKFKRVNEDNGKEFQRSDDPTKTKSAGEKVENILG